MMHELKKQKLIEKAKSRSVHAVLGCAPVGAADIGSAPRLVAAFAMDGRTNEEAVRMHALAMRDRIATSTVLRRYRRCPVSKTDRSDRRALFSVHVPGTSGRLPTVSGAKGL